MNTLKRIQLKEQELQAARDAHVAALKRKRLKCVGCGKQSVVGKLTYYQDMGYVPPRGCTEGDYYYEGKSPLWRCKCGLFNRDCGSQVLSQLRSGFAAEERVYDNELTNPWKNI